MRKVFLALILLIIAFGCFSCSSVGSLFRKRSRYPPIPIQMYALIYPWELSGFMYNQILTLYTNDSVFCRTFTQNMYPIDIIIGTYSHSHDTLCFVPKYSYTSSHGITSVPTPDSLKTYVTLPFKGILHKDKKMEILTDNALFGVTYTINNGKLRPDGSEVKPSIDTTVDTLWLEQVKVRL